MTDATDHRLIAAQLLASAPLSADHEEWMTAGLELLPALPVIAAHGPGATVSIKVDATDLVLPALTAISAAVQLGAFRTGTDVDAFARDVRDLIYAH